MYIGYFFFEPYKIGRYYINTNANTKFDIGYYKYYNSKRQDTNTKYYTIAKRQDINTKYIIINCRMHS